MEFLQPFQKSLLRHQREDADFLASKSFAANWSGMGSGKTLTALQACRQIFKQEDTQPELRRGPYDFLLHVIIIGPPISLHMWEEEVYNHLNIPAQIIRSAKEYFSSAPGALIMSYDIATKRKEELKELNAKILICDEAHALKSTKAKRTKAILGRGGLCESVDYTWLLTGTPSTRWNDDLYPFLCRADLDGLKKRCGGTSLEKFRLRYCVTQKKTFDGARFPTMITVGNRNTEELNDWIFNSGRLSVRRELQEIWEAMPPLTINNLTVELDADADLRQNLKEMDKLTYVQIEEGVRNNDEHISSMRRKIGVAKVKHSVAEIINRIEVGISPILVGAWHTDVIDAIVTELQKAGISQCKRVIDGRTSAAQKQAAQELFNAGKIDVLIGQIGAMGVSLNMQGGSHIIEVEQDWSPAIMDQFRARCHRMGQKNRVHVDCFHADTKLDRAVKRISLAKRRGHNTLMDQGASA